VDGRPEVTKTVRKFPLPIEDYVELDMPVGAKIIKVGEQFGKLCIWALVDPSARTEQRHLRIAGTGHPVEPEAVFIGTAICAHGALVWHVFELPDERQRRLEGIKRGEI
jgi:hypothetical protein